MFWRGPGGRTLMMFSRRSFSRVSYDTFSFDHGFGGIIPSPRYLMTPSVSIMASAASLLGRRTKKEQERAFCHTVPHQWKEEERRKKKKESSVRPCHIDGKKMKNEERRRKSLLSDRATSIEWRRTMKQEESALSQTVPHRSKKKEERGFYQTAPHRWKE